MTFNRLTGKKFFQKSLMIFSTISFLSCSIEASNILDEVDDLHNSAKAFFSQNIVEPFIDAAHDFEKYVERTIRPKPSNYLDKISQGFSDSAEDIQDKIKREGIRPAKRIFKIITKKLD